MRLNKEDYRRAVGLLKRYNYNCLTIMNIESDIINIGSAPISDMPRTPYSVGDTTARKVIELQENEQLQRSNLEIKIVNQALELVSQDARYVFQEFFRKGNTRWNIDMSERTFFRRKKELIVAVHFEAIKFL